MDDSEKVLFDYAPSLFGKPGETPVSLPCTRSIFEGYLDSPYIANIYKNNEQLMSRLTPEMTEEQRSKVLAKIAESKKRLPLLIPGAHSLTGMRKVTGPADYVRSPFITLDIDHVDDPKALWDEKIAPHIKRLLIALAFITPSTKGVKVIALCPSNIDKEQGMAWLANELGIEEFDKCVKDPLRAHFMPCREYLLYYDPEMLFNTELSNEGYLVEAPSDKPSTQAKPETRQPEAPALPSATSSAEVDAQILAGYYGVPYDEIVRTYIEVIWGGKEPIQGDRNVKTLELASQMRYICDNNVALLDRIIPSFCQFTEAEKLSVIQSATKYELKLMPRNLRDVLTVVKGRHTEQPEIVKALDEVETQQQSHYSTQLVDCFERNHAKLPMGIRDSFDGVNPTLWMAMFVGICPFIGGLATEVRLKVHDDFAHLNLFTFVVGEAGSGKARLDSLYSLWLSRLIASDDVNLAIEEEWKALPQKKKESTPQPVIQIRIQPLRCSIADALSHLKSATGKHLISYASEADQFTQSQKSGAYANVSVLIREAYDGAEFKSSYAGSSSVNANIKNVHWNFSMCTTPDGLRRAVPNVTDGHLTRMAIAVTPDNTYASLVRVKSRSEASERNIKRVAELLEYLKGDVELPELEQTCADWLEKVRLDCLKDDNKVRARQRFRVAVTAMRMVCCLMLCGYVEWLDKQFARNTKSKPKWMHEASSTEEYLKTHPDAVSKHLPRFQTREYLETFTVIADYLIENILFYFGKKIAKAYEQDNYAGDYVPKRKGKNASLFDSLENRFTINDIRQAKGDSCSLSAVYKIAQRWEDNKLCRRISNGLYEKI